LDLNIPKDLWSAEVDEGQLSQVINNLVINADQAMPEGGILMINAENIPPGAFALLPLDTKNQSYIKITITDEGIGIDKDHLEKIFDPYFTTKDYGIGLGLTTTFAIIQKHQGFIKVKSILGKGTTFNIY